MKCYYLYFLLPLCIPLCLEVNAFDEAKLTLLHDAVNEGAVCLDGTAPGYYMRKGFGNGSLNWILHLEGGGWCYDENLCVERSETQLGSSKHWGTFMTFSGFLSRNPEVNPDFYNWNVVFIKYCDGASFAGNVEQPQTINGTTIYFRGFRILKAILNNLLLAGLSTSEQVILTGCSAGGLATYLHADFVSSMLPANIKYHALADAGYFIDAPNTSGQMHIRELYQYVFKMQNCSGGINQACIKSQSPGDEWKCFFAQYTYPHIVSPFFTFNSQIDTWQLGNILQLGCTPPNCNDQQMEKFEHFYEEFKQAEIPILDSKSNGGFLDSCLAHCQSLSDAAWIETQVNNQSARETFSYWYFGRSGERKVIDCAYPCNKSCK